MKKSACLPETLILRRSFYNPPWLQPWCQRNQRSIFIWILSHWNIEWHLGLKSVVVSAAKSEHADNPTMGAEKLFCLRSLQRNIITSNYIRECFECWNQQIVREPREPISDVSFFVQHSAYALDIEIRKKIAWDANDSGCSYVKRIDWINPRSSHTRPGVQSHRCHCLTFHGQWHILPVGRRPPCSGIFACLGSHTGLCPSHGCECWSCYRKVPKLSFQAARYLAHLSRDLHSNLETITVQVPSKNCAVQKSKPVKL